MWELETKSIKTADYGERARLTGRSGRLGVSISLPPGGGTALGPSLQVVAPPLSYGAIGRSIVVAAPGW
jgi:hypothetical protein